MGLSDKIINSCITDIRKYFNNLKGILPPSKYDQLLARVKENENIFYFYYPFLFYDYNDDYYVDKLLKATFAGNLFYLYLLLFDEFLDNEGDQSYLIITHFLHESSIKILCSIFNHYPQFWEYFKKYENEFFNAVMYEKKRHNKVLNDYGISEMELIAKGKSAFGKLAIAAVSILTEQEDNINLIELSHDNFHIALQLIDDLTDWKKDYNTHSYSYLLMKVIENLKCYDQIKSKKYPDTMTVGKAIHFSGVTDEILDLAISYFDKSMESVENLKGILWKKVVHHQKNICLKLKDDLSKIREDLISNKNKKSNSVKTVHLNHNFINIKVNKESIIFSVNKAINFLLKGQSEEGFWADFNLNVGESTEWITGYIGYQLKYILDKDIVKENQLESSLEKAANWLFFSKHVNGGWGFNKDSGVDADSTSNCLLFLLNYYNREKLEVDKDVLFENQNEDGGLGTYSKTRIEYEIDNGNPYFSLFSSYSYRGWCSSDPYVTAIGLLTLISLGMNKNDLFIKKGLTYIINNQTNSGYWNAYWSASPILATNFCIDILRNVGNYNKIINKTYDWLISAQCENGGWRNEINKNPNSYDTALAIKTLLYLENIDCNIRLENAVKYLLSSQLDDGSWMSSSMMLIPNPWETQTKEHKKQNLAADAKRLFTTATVVNALGLYYKQKY